MGKCHLIHCAIVESTRQCVFSRKIKSKEMGRKNRKRQQTDEGDSDDDWSEIATKKYDEPDEDERGHGSEQDVIRKLLYEKDEMNAGLQSQIDRLRNAYICLNEGHCQCCYYWKGGDWPYYGDASSSRGRGGYRPYRKGGYRSYRGGGYRSYRGGGYRGGEYHGGYQGYGYGY